MSFAHNAKAARECSLRRTSVDCDIPWMVSEIGCSLLSSVIAAFSSALTLVIVTVYTVGFSSASALTLAIAPTASALTLAIASTASALTLAIVSVYALAFSSASASDFASFLATASSISVSDFAFCSATASSAPALTLAVRPAASSALVFSLAIASSVSASDFASFLATASSVSVSDFAFCSAIASSAPALTLAVRPAASSALVFSLAIASSVSASDFASFLATASSVSFSGQEVLLFHPAHLNMPSAFKVVYRPFKTKNPGLTWPSASKARGLNHLPILNHLHWLLLATIM